MTNYESIPDDQLLELLYTEEDRLPRAAVDEFLRRGEGMVELLGELAEDLYEWRYPDGDQWAAVHATFILGASGSLSAVPALLKVLRFSSAYDNDWVSEVLPAIFGRIGRPAMDGLRYIAFDRTSDWDPRVVAVISLEAVAGNHPDLEDEAVAVLGKIFLDKTEDRRVRGMAAISLLNLARADYQEQLTAFARDVIGPLPGDAGSIVEFTEDEVARAFARGRKKMPQAAQDWLAFYSDEQIRERQARWKEEFAEDEFDDTAGYAASSRTPVMLERAKVGRNEPCPCGSGKKYKKCCLGKGPEDRAIPF